MVRAIATDTKTMEVSPIPKPGLLLAWVLLSLLCPIDPSWAEKISPDESKACLSATGQTAVRLCSDALEKDARNVDIRIALGDAYMQIRRYEQAISVFRAGTEIWPKDNEMKVRLSRAEQLYEEERWIEKQKQKREQSSAAGKSSQQRIAASRYEIRCNKLSGSTALKACDEGLLAFPGNAALYRGRGDALMDLRRYGEALKAYKDAQVLNPADASTQRRILKARTQRKVSLQKCRKLDGQIALDACRSAFMKNSNDESVILHRQGDLLKSMGKPREAIKNYQAALAIDSQNTQLLSKIKAMGVNSQPDKAVTPVRTTAAVQPATKPISPKKKRAKPSQPPPEHKPAPPAPEKEPLPSVKTPKKIQEKKSTTTTVPQPPAPAEIEPPVEEKPTYTNAPLPSGFTH